MCVGLISIAALAFFSCLLINGSRAAESGHDQQQVFLEIEGHWLRSEDSPSALESILADDFVQVLPFGFVTKSEQLNYMSGHPTLEEALPAILKIVK